MKQILQDSLHTATEPSRPLYEKSSCPFAQHVKPTYSSRLPLYVSFSELSDYPSPNKLSVMVLPSLFETILLVLFSVILYRLSQRSSPSSEAAHKSGPEYLLGSGSIAREEKETSSTCRAPVPSPTCFRVSNIPSAWNEGDLLKWTQNLDPSWKGDGYRISLYPSYHGTGQTALLNTKHCPATFSDIDRGKAKAITVKGEGSDKEVILSVDCDFYNLTPLNKPKGDIVAELAPPLR